MPALITLLTDFGFEDEYVGVVKGVILSIHPSARLVDISHAVPPGDLVRASWLLSWSWSCFPKGTVHLTVVDPGVGSSRKILCLEKSGHLFLAPDNGILSRLLTKRDRFRCRAVTNRRYFLKNVSRTFHGRDIFAPVAAHLSKGVSPDRLGPRVDRFQTLPDLPVVGSPKGIKGQIILIDRFGNLVTNLPAEQVLSVAGKGKLEIRLKGKLLSGLQPSYSAVGRGRPLAVIGSHDLLEIAVNRGSAANRFGVKVGDPVQVRGV